MRNNISPFFHQVPFELIPNAQIWPRQLNADIGGTAGSIYLIVADLGNPSGAGLDFFLGQAFLERFYSIYDTTNSKVGLARTKYTDATTNWDIPMSLIPGLSFPTMIWYIVSGRSFDQLIYTRFFLSLKLSDCLCLHHTKYYITYPYLYN